MNILIFYMLFLLPTSMYIIVVLCVKQHTAKLKAVKLAIQSDSKYLKW